MSFVQATALSLAFGNRDILKNIHINLDSTTRAALCGSNGSGKSSLLKILAGKQVADSGKINSSTEIRIAYLPQTGITHAGKTILEEMENAFQFVINLIEEKKHTEEQLSKSDKNSPDLPKLLEKQYHLDQQILESGYYEREKAIYNVLCGLGFLPNQFGKDCSTFSGGWQMRIALARTLLQHPDILLLDEPTNYLDLEAREWLTQFLKNLTGGYLLVSHDRYFLDSTVDEIYEVFQGDLKRYKGSYTQYEAKRAQELETLIKLFKKQEEEIEKNELFIRRFRAKASKASAVQSRVKQLDKIDRIELPDNMKKISIRFPDPPRCGDSAVLVENLSRSYGNHTVFKGINFHINRGEKVAFTGVNGAGKTTLLKAIAGVDKKAVGKIQLGTGVSIGYFAQESSELLDESLSIEEEIERDCPTEQIPKIRALAGAFLFFDDDIYKKVGILSGGERNRLTLLKLMLQPYNLLVLDEPTNHLDLHSKDILLEALQQFQGTILFVSHDRYFLENLAHRVIHLEGGSFKDYLGDYQYYLWRQSQEDEALQSETTKTKTTSQSGTPPILPNKSHQEEKELRNKIRSFEKKEARILEDLGLLEKELVQLNEQLMQPEVYSDPQKATHIAKLKAEEETKIEELTQEWENLLEEQEILTGN